MKLNKYRKLKIVILLIIVIGGVFTGLVVAWNIYLKNNADKVFLNSIAGELRQIDFKSAIGQTNPYINMKGSIKLSGDTTRAIGEKTVSKMEDVNISWNGSSNTKQIAYNSNLLLTVGSKTYMNTDFVISNNSMYVKFKDTFDKYIEVFNYGNRENNKQYTDKEIKEISKHLSVVFENSLKKEYFTYDKQDVKLGDVNSKLNTVSIKIDNEKIKQISINAVQNLKDDGYLVEELAIVNGLTKIEQFEQLEKSIQEMKAKSTSEDDVKYVVSISVDFFGNTKQIKIQTENKTDIVYNKYNGVKEYILTDNDKSNLNLKSMTIKGIETLNITGNFEDSYIFGEIKGKNIDAYNKEGDYYIYQKNKESDTDKQFEIKGNYTSTNNKLINSNKPSESKLEINMAFESKGQNISNMKLLYNNKQEIVDSYITPDLSKKVKYEKLTQSDYNQLIKGEPFKSVAGIAQMIMGITSNFVTDKQDENIAKAKYTTLLQERITLKENVTFEIAKYMGENNGTIPVVITVGTAKQNELKIELTESQKIYTISSSGEVTYKANMTADEFVNSYALVSEMEIPEWVQTKASESTEMLTKASEDLKGLSTALDNQLLAKYDSKTLAGGEVIVAIRQYYNDRKLVIYIDNEKGVCCVGARYISNVSGNIGQTRVSVLEKNIIEWGKSDGTIKPTISEFYDTSSIKYIDLSKQYNTSIIQNKTTGDSIGIAFKKIN